MLSIIISSCPPPDADRLARALVDRRVAACVSAVAGAQSTYRWQGEVHSDPETLLIIKVPKEGVEACMAALREIHPCSVPELIELEAGRVGADYLAWALAETR